MKNHLIVLAIGLSVFVLQSCKIDHPRQDTDLSSADNVTLVENGLTPLVFFKGDTSWTLQERMTHYRVPGMSIAVINNYEIDWSKSYGIKDRDSQEPVVNTTLFQAGSISKPVAAYGALRMVDSGIIDAEQNVNRYLRSWQVPNNQFTEKQKVSLQHLLSHTGGVTVHGFLGYTVYEEVPSLLQLLDGRPPANSPAITVDKIPGEGFRYSGGGYCIMQQMLIDVTGEPFPDILEKLVLGPLKMDHSSFEQPLPAAKLQMAATGYLPDGSMTRGRRHIYPEMAAAGLWTTAEDLAKFVIDIQLSIKGERNLVLSPAMATRMLTPFIENFIGLGIFLDHKKNNIYFQHGGWDEGFSSQLVAHKDKGYGVVVLTNSNHPAFIDEVVRAVARAYQWEEFLPPVYEQLEISAAEITQYAGRYYHSTDNVFTIFSEDNRLFGGLFGDQPTEMLKIADNLFISREYNEKVQFMVNPADDLLYLIFTNNSQGDSVDYKHRRLMKDEMVPFEYLLQDRYDKALQAYQKIKRENPEEPAIQEHQLNRRGYALMEIGELPLAISLFKINVALYPQASNTYDSLGEAYMKNGEHQLAIRNYKRSLELNPNNNNAKEMLQKLELL